METPQVPTKLSELFAQFANALPKAGEPQAKFSKEHPPSEEAMQAEFERFFRESFETLEPVMRKIHMAVSENANATASDGSSAFGAHRVQGVLAAITGHLAVAVEGFVLSLDVDDEERREAVAATVLMSILRNVKIAIRKALKKCAEDK